MRSPDISDPESIPEQAQGVIDTSAEAFEQYLADGDGPVTIMNLLRFAPHGRTLYQDYLARVAVVMADYGGEILYAGDFSSPLIPGRPGGWDAVVLARYTARSGLFKVARDLRLWDPLESTCRHASLSIL